MNENDTLIIHAIKDSYIQQLGYYRALDEIGKKIMSRLVLSRGDVSGIKADLAEKQRLLRCIEEERAKNAPQVRQWQERKKMLETSSAARELDAVLQEIECVIRNFIDGEDQLKTYIEGLLKKSAS